MSFWDARWREGKIGFHLSSVNPGLVEHWPAPQEQGSPARVLVPLCGKTHDLAWLAARGHDVVGIEFIESAAESFFVERGLSPRRELHRGAVCLGAEGVTIFVADIFALPELELPPFQWVYDRAALVALEPDRRADYAAAVAQSCAPDAEMLLLSFDHDMGSGPPFSVTETSVRECYGPHFDLKLVADQDVLATEPRFRESGAKYMREQFYLGRRTDAA